MPDHRFFNNVMTRLLIIFLSCMPSIVVGQTKEIDQLTSAIIETKDFEKKSNLFCRRADKLFSLDLEKGLFDSNEALALSRRANYLSGQAQALTSIGDFHFYKGDYIQARQFYKEALQILKEKIEEDFPIKTYLKLSLLNQQQSYFDSANYYLNLAKDVIETSKQEKMQASLFHAQGLLAHLQSRNSNAIKLFKRSIALRMEFNDSIGAADSWVNIGIAYTYLSLFDSAKLSYEMAESFLHQADDPEQFMYLNLYRGETAFSMGDFNDATKYYTEALSFLKGKTYKRYYPIILLKIGELNEGRGSYNIASDYLFQALKEFEKFNARQDMARAYSLIGWCYKDNFPVALENANKSLSIATQIGDSASIAQNQNLIGYINYNAKKYKEAIDFFEQALTIRKHLKLSWGVSYTLYNLGLCYIALNETEKANNLLSQALDIDQKIGKKMGIVLVSNALGILFAKKGDFIKSSHYLSNANTLAKQIPMPTQLLVNYRNYIFLSEQQKNPSEIIKYYKLYTALKDSLSNDINSTRISKADALFQLQKKAVEVELVNRKNELHQEKIKAQQAEIAFQRGVIMIVLSCLFILFVLATVIYKLFKSNKRAKEVLSRQNTEILEQREELQTQSEELLESNQKLHDLNTELNDNKIKIEIQAEHIREANEELEAINDELETRVRDRTGELNKAYNELETFFYRTSHDFRRPLTTYLGLVELANSSVKDKHAIELFEKIRETTLDLDGMLGKLQAISNMDSGSVYAPVNLRQLIDECCLKYSKKIAMKKIKVTTDVSLDCIDSMAALIKIAVENLIENAINFCAPDNPFITIKVTRKGETASIKIEDNGQGIAEDVQPNIFDMYFRGNINSKGNGLGLYISKRALEKIGGSILFKSTIYLGSSFEISIPTSSIQQ